MTSRIFRCSREWAMNETVEVLHDMKLRNYTIDHKSGQISARRGWRFIVPPCDIDINIYADEDRVEVAVNTTFTVSLPDFGTGQYLEDEFLQRLREKLW